MPAPNEFPHHGRADQARPAENEYVHDLPLPWKPRSPDDASSIITTRWLCMNIALQRGPLAENISIKIE
jgi:hypothetical protein